MRRRDQLILAVVIVVGLNLVFLLSFWNRFLAPSVSGMFLEFAYRLLRGEVPYRDFYVVVTPLYIFKTAAIVKLFGPYLVGIRFIEIVYRCATVAILLILLAKAVRLPYAVLGTLAAAVMLSADTADSLTSYHQEAIFWALIGTLLLSLTDWGKNDGLKNTLLFACAGISCAVCFFTKQTSGVGITVALMSVIAALSVRDVGLRRGILRLFVFCVGWAIPATALLGWLASRGALSAFIKAIFFDGPSAKGSLGIVLTRAFYFVAGPPYVKLIIVANAITFMTFVVLLARRGRPPTESDHLYSKLAVIGICGFLSLTTGYFLSGFYNHFVLSTQLLKLLLIIVGLLGSLSLAAYYLVVLFTRQLTVLERQRWILAVSSFWICYTLSWSWKAWEPMAFPSAAVAIAFLLDGIRTRWARYFVAVPVFMLLFMCEAEKVQSPFTWEGWNDLSVRAAVASSSQTLLEEIHMSPGTANYVDQLTHIIQRYSRPSDPVFIYAYQPLWYVLANRWPPTYA